MHTTKQRGSGWSVKLALNIYKVFGYRFIYYLMYPVSFFYYFVSSNVRESLNIYYQHLGIKLTNALYYKHLRIFAITMLDRFISKADPKSYTFIYSDQQRTLQLFSNAMVLVHSHFGGWATASNMSSSNNMLNIVMQEALFDSIKAIENSMKQKETVHIIDVNKGPIVSSIEIGHALIRNEVVAIMGDRTSSNKANFSIEFFGEEAYFNKSPFQIAYRMKKPLVAYFIILTAIQHYNVTFIEIDMDYELNQDESIAKAMQIYVEKYTSILKKYPQQWFNFYDFWNKDNG
ncbi:lipid A biosynthesis acyltransferase [Sulfurimonas sp. SAG-AH-194-I05]|nr:lipid A biosynthesis acyltransferase [Sulfurimonas sp. SAG-AH-194-I05]MDF1874729.1 lipid A biosynthesis acyltransferase [Sulfurimonas sp. SAG-AH-194-I05]